MHLATVRYRGGVLRLWTPLIVLLGLALTALAWTPSSYGVVLRQLGAPEAGLIWGEPQEIRSDEYAVWTPLVQATTRNSGARHNATSPYGEDLRNFNALPLWDWALPLKPAMWGFYGPLDPARAFAWSWALPLVAFLLGWERLGAAGSVGIDHHQHVALRRGCAAVALPAEIVAEAPRTNPHRVGWDGRSSPTSVGLICRVRRWQQARAAIARDCLHDLLRVVRM